MREKCWRRRTDLSGDRVATKGDEDREVGVLQLEAVHVGDQACSRARVRGSGWIEDRLGWVVGFEVCVGTMIISSVNHPSIRCIKKIRLCVTYDR